MWEVGGKGIYIWAGFSSVHRSGYHLLAFFSTWEITYQNLTKRWHCQSDVTKVFLLHNLQAMIMFFMNDPFEESACINSSGVYAFAPFNWKWFPSYFIFYVSALLWCRSGPL